MNLLRTLIKILCFPFLMITLFAYPAIKMKNQIVCQAWYLSRKDYNAALTNCIGDKNYRKTYDEWCLDAETLMSHYSSQGSMCFKIIIKPNELNRWLKTNTLPNCSENREQYAAAILRDALDYGISKKDIPNK
jgi:hypothetical protein